MRSERDIYKTINCHWSVYCSAQSVIFVLCHNVEENISRDDETLIYSFKILQNKIRPTILYILQIIDYIVGGTCE